MPPKHKAPPKVESQTLADTTVLQGALMAVQRVEGKSIDEIAKGYGLSSDTVRKRINEAKQADLVAIAREIITEKLMPKAIAVVDRELSKGNYQAAKDVLFGSDVLRKTGASTITHVSGSPTLDAIRAEAIDVEVNNASKSE